MADEQLDQTRRFYAEELRAVGPIEREEVIEAFARIPRERFLGPPPWKISNPPQGYRDTPDGDPRHVYHNVIVALDPARVLNNGQPGLVGMLIDQTGAAKGHHAVHVGCGTGYYSAILAELVGESGHLTAIEVDAQLAERAAGNLAHLRQVDVVHGDGTTFDPGAADAILVNAGATHVKPLWVDRLLPGATLIVPLTIAAPLHGIGAALKVTREAKGLAATFLGPLGIFPCAGGRDDPSNERLSAAFETGPTELAAVRSLREDEHPEAEDCWLHTPSLCISKKALA